MNVIEFIENKVPIIDTYYRLKDVKYLTYTLIDNMEGGSNLWILNKNQVNSIEEAMLVLILVDEMIDGTYFFTEEDEREVLDLNLDLLKEKYHYQIQPNRKSLTSIFEQFSGRTIKTYKNNKRKFPIDMNVIKNEPFFDELMVCSFQLLDDWNDIDYIFETKNHYVRISWTTGA